MYKALFKTRVRIYLGAALRHLYETWMQNLKYFFPHVRTQICGPHSKTTFIFYVIKTLKKIPK